MKEEEIPTHPREPQKDVEQRRTTDRGTDPGTSEPGVPPRPSPDESREEGAGGSERSDRSGAGGS